MCRKAAAPGVTDQVIWIDLLNPTLEEEKKIERALKLDVPTREEQQEIEVSSSALLGGGRVFYDRNNPGGYRYPRAVQHTHQLHPLLSSLVKLRRAASIRLRKREENP